jgi:hypothetical protein
MDVERRSLIQILGAGLATSGTGFGQHSHAKGSAAAAGNYTPRALTAAEYRVVDILTELILPADGTSPGAHDAGVARYIDIVLLYGDKATLGLWRDGVKFVDAAAREAHGHTFSEITPEQQTGIVRTMAANETNPTTQLEKFFVAVKRLAIEAFYLSSAGRQSLGYKGDRAIVSFPGCQDKEHQA